jgi:glycine hydroxymethyltransferase
MTTSGIRVGTAAITSRGLKEADCVQVVEWMDEAIMNDADEMALGRIGNAVNEFMKQFPLY